MQHLIGSELVFATHLQPRSNLTHAFYFLSVHRSSRNRNPDFAARRIPLPGIYGLDFVIVVVVAVTRSSHRSNSVTLTCLGAKWQRRQEKEKTSFSDSSLLIQILRPAAVSALKQIVLLFLLYSYIVHYSVSFWYIFRGTTP